MSSRKYIIEKSSEKLLRKHSLKNSEYKMKKTIGKTRKQWLLYTARQHAVSPAGTRSTMLSSMLTIGNIRMCEGAHVQWWQCWTVKTISSFSGGAAAWPPTSPRKARTTCEMISLSDDRKSSYLHGWPLLQTLLFELTVASWKHLRSAECECNPIRNVRSRNSIPSCHNISNAPLQNQ